MKTRGLDSFHIITLTHKFFSIKELGRFILPENSGRLLAKIKDTLAIEELYYLGTCNRICFLFVRQDIGNPDAFLKKFYDTVYPGLPDEVIQQSLTKTQFLKGSQAIRHLHEVAASMDSMVVGEREIFKQVKYAYDRCKQAGLTGDHIRLVIKSAITTAKRVFHNTGIARRPVSVVSIAMEKLKNRALPKDSRIILVGAGQTISLVSKFLIKYGFHNVRIFNRTLENAYHIADRFNTEPLPLDALKTYNAGFDVLIICTGKAGAVIDPDIYSSLSGDEKNEKIIIDLAVPANIDPVIPAQFPVHYIGMDLLQQESEKNIDYRHQELERAHEIIDEGMEDFHRLLRQRAVERALCHIPDTVKEISQRALQDVFRKEIETLDPEASRVLMKVISYMEKKYINIPYKEVRRLLHLLEQTQ